MQTSRAALQSPQGYLRIATPVYDPQIIPSGESAIGVAFKAVFARVVIPTAGTLKDLTVFNKGAPNGNHNVAVYDTGQAVAGKYTLLWESGSVAAAGENKPQVVGTPDLAVTAGQQLMFAVMSSGTTHKFGIAPTLGVSNFYTLPASFIPTTGGASPKTIGFHTFAELKYATITEAELEVAGTPAVIIGRIV